MNVMEQTNASVELPPESVKTPERAIGMLDEMSHETEAVFTKKHDLLHNQIETSPLSPEVKESYERKGESLLKRYKDQAAKLRNIAVVALALNTTPTFAQFENTDHLEGNVAATQTVEQEKPGIDFPATEPVSEIGVDVEQQDNLSASKTLGEIDPEATSSIILDSLNQAAKSKIEEAMDKPVESGVILASKFAKGPLKHLSNLIDLAKSVKESSEKGESGAEIAKNLGRLLVDMKTFGLGGLVFDYLKSQSVSPQSK